MNNIKLSLGKDRDGAMFNLGAHFYISWFEIRETRRFADEEHYAIWAVGTWSYHMMDWRGCNMRQKKITVGGSFDSVDEAEAWLMKQIAAGHLYEGQELYSSSFYGDGDDVMPDARTVYFPKQEEKERWQKEGNAESVAKATT